MGGVPFRESVRRHDPYAELGLEPCCPTSVIPHGEESAVHRGDEVVLLTQVRVRLIPTTADYRTINLQ